MSNIDWKKKIETLDGKPCRVVETDDASKNYPVRVMFPDGYDFWLKPDGTWCDRKVRNVAEPKDDVPEWAVKRALAEVNDFPTGPGGGEKWTMDEIIDRRRGVFRYQAAVITLARYIAAHEQSPADPDNVEATALVGGLRYDGFNIDTMNEGICVEAALRAIKRGRELERGEGK